ncbi:MAG TPA: hypothetical protein ENN05_11120 [Deltaproteobacteria bacterium]|nr:hypothetical protein [Deltaproteobacteria bacterium]
MKSSLSSLGYARIEYRDIALIFKTSRPELPALLMNQGIIGSPSDLKGRTPVHILEPDMVARTLTHGGLFGHIAGPRFLSTARSMRELEVSAFLTSEGVPTPEILAVRIIRKGIFHHISVISRLVSDSVDLLTYLQEHSGDRFSLTIFEQTGDLIRRIHESGVYHADLHIKNILLDKNLLPWILDLDKAYRFSRLGFILRRKTMNRFIHSCRKWHKKNRITLPEEWESALRMGYDQEGVKKRYEP